MAKNRSYSGSYAPLAEIAQSIPDFLVVLADSCRLLIPKLCEELYTAPNSDGPTPVRLYEHTEYLHIECDDRAGIGMHQLRARCAL